MKQPWSLFEPSLNYHWSMLKATDNKLAAMKSGYTKDVLLNCEVPEIFLNLFDVFYKWSQHQTFCGPAGQWKGHTEKVSDNDHSWSAQQIKRSVQTFWSLFLRAQFFFGTLFWLQNSFPVTGSETPNLFLVTSFDAYNILRIFIKLQKMHGIVTSGHAS